jgi:succinyl-diaminopimelate desuccinylase
VKTKPIKANYPRSFLRKQKRGLKIDGSLFWRIVLYNRHIMKELLQKLIQAETTVEKGELAAAKIIANELSCSGVDSQIDNWDGTRANIIAHIKSANLKPALLFVCHLDVVGPGEAAWNNPPFAAVESDGKIYGRGATDMKGGIAAIVTAIKQAAKAGTKLQGDIILFCAAGEETDSCGVRRFISESSRLPKSAKGCLMALAGIVIPEPTDFAVVTAHRGMAWIKVVTKGKAAHSSQPELGINAINSMKAFLNELDNYRFDIPLHPLLGSCSMSVNTISGGKVMNVVPDQCTIGIDIRTLPGQNHEKIVDSFKQIFTRLKQQNPTFSAEVFVDRAVEAIETDPQCTFVREFCGVVGANKTKAVGFTTDAPHLRPLGAPIIIFGPGKPELCHKPDEYIDISDVERAVEHYKKIIMKFLL